MRDSKVINSINHFLSNFKECMRKYDRFYLYFIFTLEITECEINAEGIISNETASALCQLFVFQAHELFYIDNPDLYKESINLFSEMVKYNSNLEKNDIVALGIDKDEWTSYFIKKLDLAFN